MKERGKRGGEVKWKTVRRGDKRGGEEKWSKERRREEIML